MFPPLSGGYGYPALGLFGALQGYGSLDLTVQSPPQSFVEPLTLAEVQEFLQLPDSMATAQAITLNTFISAAREQAEILQGRDLVTKQWDMSFDFWPAYHIQLRPNLQSIDMFTYRDATGAYYSPVQGTDYVVDFTQQPGIMTPPYGGMWASYTPWPSGSILIRFTAGILPNAAFWNDAGARVKVGMKLLISAWFSGRLPFGASCEEMPYAVTSCLSYGAVPRVR